MSETESGSNQEWYDQNRARYERLADSVRATLVSAITHANIPYLSVTARAKEIDSFREKIARKGYQNPQQEMTDLAGIRVIAYIESDVERICDLVRSAFRIHPDQSLDKRAELGKDRFGYRSVHFVCDLGEHRLKLSENTPYKDHVFEVQVRTVLQHAWAEIEHDRGYKFSGNMPAEIERQLNAQAAILEVVDREFTRIADELDKYAIEVRKQADSGEFKAKIDRPSLSSYMQSLAAKIPNVKVIDITDVRDYETVIGELSRLGIFTLADLNPYFSPEFLQRYQKDNAGAGINNYRGLIRQALLYNDPEAFYEKTETNWKLINSKILNRLVDKHGKEKMEDVLKKYGIAVSPR